MSRSWSGSEVDVAIIGAGPVGLTLANYLGTYGVSTLVIEARDELINFPRGVGMDDECLRAFQAVGLVDQVTPHTSPHQVLRFINGEGRTLLEVDPQEDLFGWPRRNGFIQPLVDRILLAGLERFEQVNVLWSHRVEEIVQDGGHAEVRAVGPGGTTVTARARYVCGCDGGSSQVRKRLGIDFEGKSEPTRWLVIDIDNDPLGTPNSYMVCDPRRPHVSIGLPHGVRRFEFMLLEGERAEDLASDSAVRHLLAERVADPSSLSYAPPRVYTHHARIATDFRRGRVLLAGDAAHLMPVWQGQGYNSGIRDAANLGWKLACVIRGLADDRLLDTYDAERRAHATAMISLSSVTGRLMSPTSRGLAWARDRAAFLLNSVPAVRKYALEMRYKPMPRYESDCLVPMRPTNRHGQSTPVGRLLIQPRVTTRAGTSVLLDDVLGPWFSLMSWGVSPRRLLNQEALAICQRLGVSFVAVRPMTELHWDGNEDPEALVVGDATGRLRRWFDLHRVSTVLVRPDRLVAGAALAQDVSSLVAQFSARSGIAAQRPRDSAIDPASARTG